MNPISSEQIGASASCGQNGTTLENDGGNKKHVSSRVGNRDKYAEMEEKKHKEIQQFFSDLLPYGIDRGGLCQLRNAKEANLRRANRALKFYNKIQGNEYELVKPLHSEEVDLYHPGSDCIERWCHVLFTAKLRSDTDGITEKYFFAEIQKETLAGPYTVKSCSILERSDWGGFNHGCVMCSPGLMLHPCKFVSGSSGYRVVKWCWY